jgi:hypothetical protein
VRSGVGGFALSLIKGSWKIRAPNGSVFVQDVRNPNGVLNDKAGSFGSAGSASYHYFDYDPLASVSFQAGDSVEITGSGAPHGTSSGTSVPILFPPSLQVIAGAGGFVLDTDVILFPSPYGELDITTHNGGNFESYVDPNDPQAVNTFKLVMSDSGRQQWTGIGDFTETDHAATPAELGNPNPVEISVSGSMNNVTVYTAKETRLKRKISVATTPLPSMWPAKSPIPPFIRSPALAVTSSGPIRSLLPLGTPFSPCC